MKRSAIIFTLALVSTGVVQLNNEAYAENEVETNSSAVTPDGTSIDKTRSHSDKIGITGTRTIEDETKITTDPSGLRNKSKEKAYSKKTIKKDGDTAQETTTVDGQGTRRTTLSEVDTTKHLDGSVTTTASRKDTVDPRGMLNRRTTEVEESVTTEPDGTTSVTKKKDGKQVPIN